MAQLEDGRAGSIRSYLDSAGDWRRQADHLRDHADQPHLAPSVSTVLLREAVAADRMAELWVAAAEKA